MNLFVGGGFARTIARCSLVVAIGLLGSSTARAGQENPPEGTTSTLSGVQVISGWKCNPGTITYRVDGGPSLKMASGTSRGDTAAICGNTGFNGYGALDNVNKYGDGAHVARFYDNGVQFAQANFDVVTLGGDPFVSGAAGSVDLFDFPNPGEGVSLDWVEGTQGFEVSAFCAGDECPSPCPSDMERVGGFCIDKIAHAAFCLPLPCVAGATFPQAWQGCDEDRRDLCTVEQIFACDNVEPSVGLFSCGALTDSAPSQVWTSTVAALDADATSSVANVIVYAGNNQLLRADGSSGGERHPYFCCKPVR